MRKSRKASRIIAAIAIPNVLRARMAANESSAVASIRTHQHRRGYLRALCAEEDGVVRLDPDGACSNTEAGVLTLNPLNQ